MSTTVGLPVEVKQRIPEQHDRHHENAKHHKELLETALAGEHVNLIVDAAVTFLQFWVHVGRVEQHHVDKCD